MNKHYRSFKNFLGKLLCPFTGAIVSLVAVSYTFVMLFSEIANKKEVIYNRSIYDSRITKEIDNIINDCGAGYFLSWIVFNEDSNNSRYYFQDVVGCAGESKNCAISIKNLHLNKFYDQEYHKVDKNTLQFFNSMQTGLAGYYEDIDYLTGRYQTIAEIAKNTNKKIVSTGITVTKDARSNIIYVFTLTNTSLTNNKCGQKEVVRHLEFLSTFAGDNI
jgi:hypothetical protein